MDVAAARTEFLDAAAASGPPAALRILLNRGAEALGIPPPSRALSIDRLVQIAMEGALSAGHRDFAVLLVLASSIPGLLPARGEAEQRIRLFLERALLNPLRRAGYPFGGTPYEKRRALTGLHATIEDHLRPPEPSIPRWIHGIGPPEQP